MPPQSELERRLFDAITKAGLPEPIRQYPLPGNRPGAEFADAAYPAAKVLIEADGRRWHTRIGDLERDRVRDVEVSEAGWVVLRFTYEQITTAPEWVATRIANVLAARLAQLK